MQYLKFYENTNCWVTHRVIFSSAQTRETKCPIASSTRHFAVDSSPEKLAHQRLASVPAVGKRGNGSPRAQAAQSRLARGCGSTYLVRGLVRLRPSHSVSPRQSFADRDAKGSDGSKALLRGYFPAAPVRRLSLLPRRCV